MTTSAGSASLEQLCTTVADITRRSVEWIMRPNNQARAGQNYVPVLRRLRRNARTAVRLRAAAGLPPSMAVYGASQAGKSYLISHLSAPPGGEGAQGASGQSVIVLPHARGAGAPFLPEGGVPFLAINPVGGRESTGLVTRFTRRPLAADAEFPVFLKLLSPLDLVRILMSCFAIDLDQTEELALDAGAIQATIASVSNRPKAAVTALDEDDIYELKELCSERFKHLATIDALIKGDYFDSAAPLVSGLDVDDLTLLLEPLWNKIPRISETFRKLMAALRSIGYAKAVHCRMDALYPRTDGQNRATTIIDVDTLKRLLASGGERIVVRHAGGLAELERPVVTALAAELVLNIAGQTRPFLEDLDLLDFPGARSRGGISRAKLAEVGGMEDVLLRGKVALLFDRYREDFDLTSMILCVGESVQEVVTLPQLVTEWVEATHGRTPEERQRYGETSLFLVLTKFDKQFERKAGDVTTSTDRWKARIDSSITSFLGRTGDWTKSWTPRKPFDNVFWYRNPFIEQPHIFESERLPDGTVVERGIRSGIQSEISDMRAAYESLDLVRQHFRDPAAAWNAVMTLNDGGVTYLTDQISRLGRRNIKQHQILQAVLRIAAETDSQLRPLYFDSDPDAQRQIRMRDAHRVAEEIAVAGDRRMFGRLLAHLMVTTGELEQLYRSVRLREDATPGVKPTAPSPRPDAGRPASKILEDILKKRPLGGAGQPESAAAVPSPAAGRQVDCSAPADLAAAFACRAYGLWTQRVHDVCRSEDVRSAFGLSMDAVQTLANEMVAGSRRIQLVEAIAEQARPHTRINAAGADLGAPVPSLLAARRINEYVSFLGAHGSLRDPQAKIDPTAPRFQLSAARDEPRLSEEPRITAKEYCVDWVVSFFDLVEANSASAAGLHFDVEQNDQLGAMLKVLHEIRQRAA